MRKVTFGVKAQFRFQMNALQLEDFRRLYLVCMAVNVLRISGVQSSELSAKDLITSLAALFKSLQNAPLDL